VPDIQELPQYVRHPGAAPVRLAATTRAQCAELSIWSRLLSRWSVRSVSYLGVHVQCPSNSSISLHPAVHARVFIVAYASVDADQLVNKVRYRFLAAVLAEQTRYET